MYIAHDFVAHVNDVDLQQPPAHGQWAGELNLARTY